MIPISESILGARDRIVAVLNAELAAELADAETASYPLPAPEVVITEPADPEFVWQRYNVDQCALWVYRDGPSAYPQIYAGDPTQYAADQVTRFAVAAIFTGVGGFELPSRNGRVQTEREWLADRAEMYRGAIIDTLTDNLFDAHNVNGLELVTNAADVTEFETIGPVARCSVVIEVLQGVVVRGTHNT